MDCYVKLEINEQNTNEVQELVLKLTMCGAVHQGQAREVFIKAEAIKGVTIE